MKLLQSIVILATSIYFETVKCEFIRDGVKNNISSDANKARNLQSNQANQPSQLRASTCKSNGQTREPGFWIEGPEETCLCDRNGSGKWEKCIPNAPSPDPFLFHRGNDLELNDDLEEFKSSDFTYDLMGAQPDSLTPGGTIQALSVDQLPSLAGQGVSITLFNIEPCGVNLPHIHPRATQLLYVLEGRNIETTFIRDNGESVVNVINKGEATFFPQDTIHFQRNLSCDPVSYLSALSSDDPGTIPASMFLNIQNLNVLQTTYGISLSAVQQLISNLPVSPALDPTCLATCGFTS